MNFLQKSVDNFKQLFAGRIDKGYTSPTPKWAKAYVVDISNFNYENYTDELDKVAQYNSWVASCLRVILKNACMPELHLWDGEEDKEDQEIMDLLQRPNPYQDYADFLKFNIFQYYQYGYSFIRKIKVGTKTVGLLPLPCASAVPIIVGNQLICQYTSKAGTERLTMDDVIFWRDTTYGASYYQPISSLQHLMQSVMTDDYISRYNLSLLKNGGQLSGVLTTDQTLTDEDSEKLSTKWKAKYGSADKNGQVAVLGKGAKYESIGVNPRDMSYQALKNINKEQILAFYHVPKVELGLTDGVNYATSKEQRKIFYETVIQPLLTDFISKINKTILLEERKTNLRFYYEYTNLPAYQEDRDSKAKTAVLYANIGFDLGDIIHALQLPFEETKYVGVVRQQYAQPAPTETQPAAEPTKRIITPARYQKAFREDMKNLFIKGHSSNEKILRNDVEKHFLTIRNDLLDFIKVKTGQKDATEDLVDALLNELSFNLAAYKEDLTQLARKRFNSISDTLVRSMLEKYDLKYNETARELAIINNHALKIKTIDDTLFKNFRQKLIDGMADNKFTTADVSTFIKDTFKVESSRAITIARTETTSVANDLTLANYQDNDVEMKGWLTAEDESVRPTHASLDGVFIKVMENWAIVDPETGNRDSLAYPGDPSGRPENVINCRCTIEPQI